MAWSLIPQLSQQPRSHGSLRIIRENVVWGQGEGKGREGDSIRKLHSKLITVSWALSQLMFVCAGSRLPLFFQP